MEEIRTALSVSSTTCPSPVSLIAPPPPRIHTHAHARARTHTHTHTAGPGRLPRHCRAERTKTPETLNIVTTSFLRALSQR